MKELSEPYKLACKEIAERTGSCPYDLYNVEPWNSCEKACGRLEGKTWVCWNQYFICKTHGILEN